jgi:hypothetical protein
MNDLHYTTVAPMTGSARFLRFLRGFGGKLRLDFYMYVLDKTKAIFRRHTYRLDL